MFGKKVLVSGVAGLVMLGTVAGSVYAAPTAQTPPGPAAAQQNWQGRGVGYQLAEAPAAKVLGMTVDQLHAERVAGKSLAEIAKAKGVKTDALVSAMVESRKATLDARVKAGTLTQAQADAALATMKAQISQSVDRTEVGPNRPADGQSLGLAFGRGAMGRQFGPQDGTGFGPRGPRW
jgi:hypothetical protein